MTLSPPENRSSAPLYSFQKEALAFLTDHPCSHLMVQAPTGSGKSKIYEEWILRRPNERFLIISPLNPLKDQQADHLKQLGICVERWGQSHFYSRTKSEVPKAGSYAAGPQVILASPESLFLSTPDIYHPIKKWLLNFAPRNLVVDECHCVWMWGPHFRPEYARVPQLLDLKSVRQSLWLSATMPKEYVKKLREEIEARAQELMVQGSFSLPPGLNIRFERVAYPLRFDRLRLQLQIYTAMQKQTLVFTNTRRTAEFLAKGLRSILNPDSVCYFHAGLSKEEKEKILEKIESKKVNTVISTSAFGMGMNFSSLDHVILWQLPFSILDLAQRLGRAGRAGKKGEGIVFFDEEDFLLLQSFLGSESPDTIPLLKTMRELSTEGKNIGDRLASHF